MPGRVQWDPTEEKHEKNLQKSARRAYRKFSVCEFLFSCLHRPSARYMCKPSGAQCARELIESRFESDIRLASCFKIKPAFNQHFGRLSYPRCLIPMARRTQNTIFHFKSFYSSLRSSRTTIMLLVWSNLRGAFNVVQSARLTRHFMNVFLFLFFVGPSTRISLLRAS